MAKPAVRPPFLLFLLNPLGHGLLSKPHQPPQFDMWDEPLMRPLVDCGLSHTEQLGDFGWGEEAVHGQMDTPAVTICRRGPQLCRELSLYWPCILTWPGWRLIGEPLLASASMTAVGE